jgi:hypothetical protein
MHSADVGQAVSAPVAPQPPAASGTPQATVQSPLFSSPADVYQGIVAQRRVFLRQIESLQDRREEIVQRLRQGAASDADRAGLDQQLTQVDQQIAAANINLAEVEGRLATAASVPGATVDPPQPDPWRNGPPEEVVMMTIFMGSMLLLPVMIAYARRIWRRSAKTEVTLPPVLVDRMESLERSMDAVAIEVERIGEGQRFVTQLLADRAKSAALPAERSGGPGGGR